jgi:acyl-CoA thioesterase
VRDLLDTFDLETIGERRYRARHIEKGRGVVLGGELMAKAIIAGGRDEPDKEVLTASGIFARGVHREEPIELVVDQLQSGRTFGSSTVHIEQGGRTSARVALLFHAPEPDLVRHGAPMPDVGSPDDAVGGGFSFGGEETRRVGGVDVGPPDQEIEGGFQLWVRCGDAPDDFIVHQALLAFVSSGWLIGTAMLRHRGYGQSMSHRDISTGVMSHTLTFHDRFDARDWLLLAHESSFAGRGRAYGRVEVFTQDGQHVATAVQDAILRGFADGQSPTGRESTVF